MSNDPDDLRMLANQINYETAVSRGMDRWERDTTTSVEATSPIHQKTSTLVKIPVEMIPVIGNWSPSKQELSDHLRIAKEEYIGCKQSDDHGGMNYWDKEIRRLEKEILNG